MKKLTKQNGASLDIVGENIKTLKTIFPDAFTEDKVDFDALRQLLGNAVDEGEEKYGLNWHGKKKARRIALTPSTGTLRPCPAESVDWENTKNLFIEGDNLEVLKLLQKSYAGKVKMIYIDPPYNTGKEFIYPDKFQDNLDTYLRYTGQKGEEGFKTSSNTESSGRYHTNWLNMMYPRLKLARNLLRDEGAIFISIDDNEVSNLRKICDEIFGEENFFCGFVWQRRSGAMDSVDNVSVDHEFVICYGKQKRSLNGIKRNYEKYKNPDNDPRGPWIADNLSAGKAGGDVYYSIEDPNTGNKFFPPNGRYWPYSPNTMEKKIQEGRILFPKKSTGRPMLKRFQNEAKYDTVPVSSLMRNQGEKKVANAIFSVLNTRGTKEVQEILGGKLFSHPKSTMLLESLSSQILSSPDDIIVDFFAGSCTTAHAVFKINIENKSSRKFIMVQLPEPCDEKSEAFKAGYKTIADIGKERIRRAAAKIKEELTTKGTKNTKDKNQNFRDFRDFRGSKIDLGFKVFKLDSSNIRAWNPDRNDLEGTLYEHTEHLISGRTEEDILYELLLKRGIDLTVPIEQKEIIGKTVYSIGYGVLFACLDTTISRDEVEELARGIAAWHKELEPATDTQVVFRDSAFADDVAKTNMTAILEQNNIAHVRSL